MCFIFPENETLHFSEMNSNTTQIWFSDYFLKEMIQMKFQVLIFGERKKKQTKKKQKNRTTEK